MAVQERSCSLRNLQGTLSADNIYLVCSVENILSESIVSVLFFTRYLLLIHSVLSLVKVLNLGVDRITGHTDNPLLALVNWAMSIAGRMTDSKGLQREHFACGLTIFIAIPLSSSTNFYNIFYKFQHYNRRLISMGKSLTAWIWTSTADLVR